MMSKIALALAALVAAVGIVATALTLRPPTPVVIARTAKMQALISGDQTLVSGGWTVENGDQLFVFIRPRIIDLQTIELTTVYIEAPPALWKSIEFKLPEPTTNRNVVQQMILSNENYDNLLKTAERQSGTDIYNTPKTTASSGSRGVVSFAGHLDGRTNNIEFGKLDWVGMMEKRLLKISLDGTHIDLDMEVQVNQLTGNITRRMTWLDRLVHAFRK